MGLLSEGHPLSWEKTKELAEHVRIHGAKQFIALYNRLKGRKGDVLKWGDEVNRAKSVQRKMRTATFSFQVEYMVLKVSDVEKTVRVSIRAKELLAELQKPENEGKTPLRSLWRPEYGSYMVEGTPGTVSCLS